MKVLKAKPLTEKIYEQLSSQVRHLTSPPQLVVIIVGDDVASHTYVKSKAKTCESIGFKSQVISFKDSLSQEALIDKIKELNHDSSITGILVQLPLPSHIDSLLVMDTISPLKDVDGFHPHNTGLLSQDRASLTPCTPQGIIELLKFYDIPLASQHAVIIGRSHIVGKPMSQLLLAENSTVTVCHSRTQNIKVITQQADILIVAAGKQEMVDHTWLKEGAIVVDVGIHRNENGKLVGDVNTTHIETKASALTPVPGGVGPMTIAMLMTNVLKASELQG